jgi:hypothetical protein
MQNRSKLSINPSDLSFPAFVNKEEPSNVEPSLHYKDNDELLKSHSKTANEPSYQVGGFVENLNKRRLDRIR